MEHRVNNNKHNSLGPTFHITIYLLLFPEYKHDLSKMELYFNLIEIFCGMYDKMARR